MINKYGADPLQTVKFFRCDPKNKKALIFIHGGAWRDPNNTYDDFQDLIEQLPDANVNMIGINYRLSPEVKHPAHLSDVIDALLFLKEKFNVVDVSLVGHSVGATLILQLLTYRHCIPTVRLLDIRIETVYFIDGIYDIADLIEEYGADYKLFVDAAFSSIQDYTTATALRGPLSEVPFDFEVKNLYLLHSLEDELLSERQLDLFARFLKSKGLHFFDLRGKWGKHEQVYRRNEIAEIIREYSLNQ